MADYLLVLLFTRLRSNAEAACLTCQHVNLHDKSLTIPDTKNHEDHVLLLSDFLYDLLNTRRANAASIYAFPGDGRLI